jgi:hypothetical protein
MVDSKEIQRQEGILSFRVRQYLKEQRSGIELRNALRTFEVEGCSAFVVGGFLRDLMLCGASANPRDIDIVFDGTSADKVEYFFWNHKERKNRFGGIRLRLGDCPFDVWSLGDTWAFRNEKVHHVEFASFPKTTFLNIDAIAFKWGNTSEDKIFSNGFFESILTRTLEINMEENPFPETCVVRSLMMASMLNFGIGPKLATYILRHSKTTSLKELQRIQKVHYGFVALDGEDLRSCFKAIDAQLSRSKNSAVFLPGQQLKFEEEKSKHKEASKKTFGTWFSKIAETVFVNMRPVRRLQNRFGKSGRPTINVLNVQPQWLKKAS